jgi:hypothetical protein
MHVPLYFPMDHSFAILKEHFLPIQSSSRIGKLLMCICMQEEEQEI